MKKTKTTNKKFKTLRELFADKKRWCDCFDARDSRGQPCLPLSPEARSFCLWGGTEYVYGPTRKGRLILRKLAKHTGRMTIEQFNDSQGYKKVLELCKKAKV